MQTWLDVPRQWMREYVQKKMEKKSVHRLFQFFVGRVCSQYYIEVHRMFSLFVCEFVQSNLQTLQTRLHHLFVLCRDVRCWFIHTHYYYHCVSPLHWRLSHQRRNIFYWNNSEALARADLEVNRTYCSFASCLLSDSMYGDVSRNKKPTFALHPLGVRYSIFCVCRSEAWPKRW